MLARGQQPTFIQLEPPSTWQLVSSQPLTLQQIERWGGIPAVDREYGVKKAELNSYEHDGIKIEAIIEKTPDPSSAYGLLTFYQTAAMQPEPGIDLAVGDSRMALMSRGHNFVRVPTPPVSQANERDVRSLLLHLGGPKPAAETLEMLPPSLPSDGIIAGSQKYLLGPEAVRRALPSVRPGLLGFDAGAEIESAEYQREGVRLTFLIISYPTPQLARVHFATLQGQLGLNRASTWRGKQQGSFVFLVRSSPGTPALAEALMNQMQVKEFVTWDKFKLPDGAAIQVQLLNLFMGNLLLILLLAGTAVLAGILMVVIRRLLSRWFPRSEWAQRGEDCFIQLNLR
jgi:hypothetical protein